MIVILKRYDLPEEHRHLAVKDLKLDVVVQYITSISFKERPQWRLKRLGHRREKR